MSHPHSTRKRAAWVALSTLVLLLAAELASRTVLGLGTPPLYESDATFEYRLLPNQDVMRFGNRIQVNRWGMRSPDFDHHKTDALELRVMAFGDSVLNGGSQIDQSALSTTLLQTELQKTLARPVAVGNISAGSWGPGNWLAYAERFGFFEADAVMLVLGSGDHADNPVFAPLGIDHPTTAPVLALQEAVQRYLPRYLPAALKELVAPLGRQAPIPQSPQADANRGLQDLDRLLQLAQQGGRPVVVVHHPDRNELNTGQYLDGFSQIRQVVHARGMPFIELRSSYRAASAPIFRDDIHHTVHGQRVMATAMHAAIAPALRAIAERSASGTRAGSTP